MWKILVGFGVLVMLVACGAAKAQSAQSDVAPVGEVVQARGSGGIEQLTNWKTQAECEEALKQRAQKREDGSPISYSIGGVYALELPGFPDNRDGFIAAYIKRFSPRKICQEHMRTLGLELLDMWIYQQAVEVRTRGWLACLGSAGSIPCPWY